MNVSFKFIFLLSLFIFFLAGCGPSKTTPSQIESDRENLVSSSESNGYPVDGVSSTVNSSYPAPDNSSKDFLQETPDLTEELGEPETGTGIIGGVLAQEITSQGFIPLTPRGLFLARIISNDAGEPALMRRGNNAPQAELLPTGIFIFKNISPDQYGIIVDIGFNQFPLVDESGNQLIVTIEAGQIIELGQILVEINQ